MTAIDASEAPVMVGLGPPPKKPGSMRKAAEGGNPFANIPLAAFEQPVWKQPSLFFPVYVVSDPAGIRQVLIDKVADYPKTAMENRFFKAIFGDGLLSREGEAWRAHRRIMAPSFDPRSVAGYAGAMASASQSFSDGWAALPDGAEKDVSDEMTALTLEIISRTMFSGDAAEMTGVTGAALQDSADAAFNFGILDVLPIIGPIRLAQKVKLMGQLFAPMDGAIARLIEARRADPGKRDLLGRLVAALDEETGAKLTAEEVRDEVLTIFVAGHETTASAMTFIWYVLSQQPEWEAKLHAELAGVLGGRAPTEADLPKLSLTRRIVEETMRLYPPAPGISARQAKKTDEIAGVRVPKGAVVAVSIWVLHRHRLLWDNPERFDPDRFLPERSLGRQRFAYLPFGGGPRVCIGQQLAMAEATLILATLAQRFRLRLRPGFKMAIRQRVTIRPRDGLPMTIERR
ncbi:MAG TPA: cytochrome P450 [Caulobacteraceae bacterium]|nr:cytochrome P450 [Caulobacteraceae bacterium]